MCKLRMLVFLGWAAWWSTFACAEYFNGVDPHALVGDEVRLFEVGQSGRDGKSFAAITVMAAPVRRLCEILRNYPAYPRFMPNTEKVEIYKAAADATWVNMTLKLPMGKVKKYRLRMEPVVDESTCRLSWHLVPWEGLALEETIADTRGYWLLKPISNNITKTVVQYVVSTDPGPVPLGLGWIVDELSEHSIPKMLNALRAQIVPSP
jgi:hypothetical protein